MPKAETLERTIEALDREPSPATSPRRHAMHEVAIRPLEWGKVYSDGTGYVSIEAKSIVGRYDAFRLGAAKRWRLEFNGNLIGNFDDRPSCQAAAQADYEARIRSALLPSPSVETGGRQSITEALRMMNCPRPCNHRPDEFTVGECVDAGECGCVAGNGLSASPGSSAGAEPYIVVDEDGNALVPDDQAAAIKAAFDAVTPLAHRSYPRPHRQRG